MFYWVGCTTVLFSVFVSTIYIIYRFDTGHFTPAIELTPQRGWRTIESDQIDRNRYLFVQMWHNLVSPPC